MFVKSLEDWISQDKNPRRHSFTTEEELCSKLWAAQKVHLDFA